jgi:hypothetical protein
MLAVRVSMLGGGPAAWPRGWLPGVPCCAGAADTVANQTATVAIGTNVRSLTVRFMDDLPKKGQGPFSLWTNF